VIGGSALGRGSRGDPVPSLRLRRGSQLETKARIEINNWKCRVCYYSPDGHPRLSFEVTTIRNPSPKLGSTARPRRSSARLISWCSNPRKLSAKKWVAAWVESGDNCSCPDQLLDNISRESRCPALRPRHPNTPDFPLRASRRTAEAAPARTQSTLAIIRTARLITFRLDKLSGRP
jgi:hypothetical protein